MTHPSHQKSFRDHLRVVRQQRLLVTLATVLTALTALGYSLLQEPTYTATASLAFQDETQALDLLGTPVAPRRQPDELASARAVSVTSPPVVRRVKAALRTDMSFADVRRSVRTEVEPVSNLVLIEARAGGSEEAAAIANEYARQTLNVVTRAERARFAAAARSLQRRQAQQRGADDAARALNMEKISRLVALSSLARPVDIAKSALAPSSPDSPKPARNTVLAALLGFVLGLFAAFVRDSLDRRLHSTAEITEHLRLPLLGYVRDGAMGHAGPLTNGRGRLEDADLEAFRILRTNLEFLDSERTLRSVIVTSALPEEGKSTVAASLAYASVAAGKSTLLVECDLRRPALAERLGVSGRPGLADYLLGAAEPQEVLQTVPILDNGRSPGNGSGASKERGVAKLACITAGGPAANPAELLGSERFSKFLSEVTSAYELVVLDTSPLLSVVDTLELVPVVDGVLICVRVSRTTRDQVIAAKTALNRFPPHPAGLVVTGIKSGDEGDYGYYSYSYAYPVESASA